MITKEDLFKTIAKSSIYGNLGFFIGAGLPMALLNNAMEHIALSWGELLKECALKFNIDYNKIKKEGVSFPEIATSLCKEISRQERIVYSTAVRKLKESIAELTCWYASPDKRVEYLSYFQTISPSWIITTNYDLVIESILAGKALSLSPENQLTAPKDFIPVYHLHGLRSNPDSIVITQEDYISLFRPNQYRLQKLPLLIKESVTVLVGYALGDMNVLTALDFSKNVYSDQKITYPNEIIQFLYVSTPPKDPYKDNDIWVVEFNDLGVLFNEMSRYIETERVDYTNYKESLSAINAELILCNEETVKRFVDDASYRNNILSTFEQEQNYLITGFLELVTRGIELAWTRTSPNGAFEGYNQYLKILMDLIEKFSLIAMPPVLIDMIAYNLQRISYYVGNTSGQSYSAYTTWENRKGKIPEETKKELINIAKNRGFHNLRRLLS